MRRIRKTHTPELLRQWIRDNKLLNHGYSDLTGTVAHRDLKDRLVDEQGFLCAYTGRRIEASTSHVEHIKPQTKCEDFEDVDYNNMVACFPSDGGDISHGYGAPVKHDWWDPANFVSPLTVDCEHHFTFGWKGQIRPFPASHEAAQMTIRVLGLDHENLRSLREARIKGFFGFGARHARGPLSKSEALKALQGIDSRDQSGKFHEYGFVLKYLLPKYIKGDQGQ